MTKPRQALLIDEPPIGVSPTAMWVFGTGPAIFLQQLHYFLNLKRQDPERYRDSFIDGRYWVYWSMKELVHQVPIGRSTDPHKRAIAALQSIGVLDVRKHRAHAWNHTNHYSINYQKFDAHVAMVLAARPIGGKATVRTVAVQPADRHECPAAIGGRAIDHSTETSTKTSTDTPTAPEPAAPEVPTRLGVEVVLGSEAEIYRPVLLEAVAGLPEILQQQIADELSDRARRVALEGAPQIGNVAAWLGAFRRSADAGELRPSSGLRAGRQQAVCKQQQQIAHQEQDQTRQNGLLEQARRREALQSLLDRLSIHDLTRLADTARDSACAGRGALVHTLVLARQVPERLEGVALRRAIDSLGWAKELEP